MKCFLHLPMTALMSAGIAQFCNSEAKMGLATCRRTTRSLLSMDGIGSFKTSLETVVFQGSAGMTNQLFSAENCCYDALMWCIEG